MVDRNLRVVKEMHPLKMQMILMNRGIKDLYRMHEYLASGGSEQAIYQLFDTKLYFKDGIIPGEEGFIETLKNAWKWLKEKVRAIVDIILNCFGIKKSSSNSASSNSASSNSSSSNISSSNSDSDSDALISIDVGKVNELRSEIGKTVEILNKSYDILTESTGGDWEYVKSIKKQLKDRSSYGGIEADKELIENMFSGVLIPDIESLNVLYEKLRVEQDKLTLTAPRHTPHVIKNNNNLDITDLVCLVNIVSSVMGKIYHIRDTLLEHTKTIDEKLKTEPNSPDQIIKCTDELMYFVSDTLYYVKLIPKYFDMSLPDWKDFGKAVENVIRGAKTIIKMPKEK